jgi:hypothetical protein
LKKACKTAQARNTLIACTSEFRKSLHPVNPNNNKIKKSRHALAVDHIALAGAHIWQRHALRRG